MFSRASSRNRSLRDKRGQLIVGIHGWDRPEDFLLGKVSKISESLTLCEGLCMLVSLESEVIFFRA